MLELDLGQHFDGFVRAQLESGRFRTASDVIRAGLRLLEAQALPSADPQAEFRRQIDEAFDDSRPSVSAEEVFGQLRAHHAEQVEADRHGG